jgi:hypothetical protein
MKRFGLISLIIIIFSLANCEQEAGLENKTTDAQVIEFDARKCGCCWGWVIKIGSDTIKTENIPGLELTDNLVFPINGRIITGMKTSDCPENMFDYYEIKEFTLTK